MHMEESSEEVEKMIEDDFEKKDVETEDSPDIVEEQEKKIVEDDSAADIVVEELENMKEKVTALEEELKKKVDELQFLGCEKAKMKEKITTLEEELKKKVDELQFLSCEKAKMEAEFKSKVRLLDGRYEMAKRDSYDLMYNKEEEILEAKVKLFKIFHELNVNNAEDDRRRMGFLKIEDFTALFPRSIDEETVMRNLQKAKSLFEYWVQNWSASSFSRWELEKLKTTYGVEIYHKVRRALIERRVAMKTEVELKPWNFTEGREATLTDILEQLPRIARRRRTPIRREDY